MTIQELRQQRQAALDAADVLSKIDTPTSEQAAEFDGYMAEVEQCDGQIKALETSAREQADRREKIAKLQASARKSSPNSANEIKVGKDRVSQDPKWGFTSLADFAMQVHDAGPNVRSEFRSQIMAAAGDGLSQGVTADGGVLVPPAFSQSIWDSTRQQSNSLLQYCDVMPIDPGVESVTFPASAETSRVDGSRWGGIQAYWKSELTQMSATKPKLRDVTLRPNELYAFAYVSEKLLRNAPQAATAYLTTAAADELNFKIGDAIFRGNGAGQPLGFLSHAATVIVDEETGQVAATIVAANIWKMYARCHANWRSGAAWFINQDCEPQLQQLSLSVGTGGVPLYVPPGGIADSPNARLLGLPVVPVEYAETCGTVGDITLGNLKAMAVGMRGMVDSATSMHLKFDYAQQAFRWIFELDAQPWLASAITPYKGSNTLSPIVQLATRA